MPENEHVPTPEELEREARRLARVRHLTVVPELRAIPSVEERLAATYELDPDPQEAA